MKFRRRKLSGKVFLNDRKINRKNKSLMMDKILSYNPGLLDGINIYKDANRNFMFLLLFSGLLINVPLISVPCCMISMFFIIKMLRFIKYNSINNIVEELAKDLSYKGIYDMEKAEDMLNEFKNKYGEDNLEYRELANMIEKYEAFVIKIECILKNINPNEKRNIKNETSINNDRQNDLLYREIKEYGNNLNCYRNYDERFSLLYKKEDGEIKKVNKAIEFFENDKNEFYNDKNAVILNGVNKEGKNLTVYLYKKTSVLQKNAL